MFGQKLTGAWQFRQVGTGDWLPATVPGGVHSDLLAAGRIPDPFVGDNEKRVQWVAEADWEYKTSFDVPPEVLAEEQVWLVCDGLDTLATVTLNGQEVGHAANMFRQWRWNVKPFLRSPDASGEPGANELRITFTSPVRYVSKKQAERELPGVAQAIPGGSYLRKAPCQFGWDWGPQLPPIGIWKDIRLEAFSGARIQQVHLRQHHADGRVTVEARVAVERWSDLPLAVSVRITAPDGQVQERHAENVTDNRAAVQVPIAQPQLWWPNGYGDQPLYTVQVALQRVEAPSTWRLTAPPQPLPESGEGQKGPGEDGAGHSPAPSSPNPRLPLPRGGEGRGEGRADSAIVLAPGEAALDKRTYKIGLRTIELRQEQDQWGRSFEFVVNGVRIFAKGSNWIPADSFPTRVTNEGLERLIRSAAETHQNMLRVWGGGLYESDAFYDLCDRYGLLVWQEFIFSCSIYPLDEPEFLENVRMEVVENIRRLRHRASLALWCGNNEMERNWYRDWRDTGLQELKAAYDRFFGHTLREWCTAQDPDHAYWPSSPSSDNRFEDPDDQGVGDAHYWDVWHKRRPFTAYRDQYPRFMSEFGFQALPPLSTIRTYADEPDWNMTSYVMEQHQKNASGNSLIVGQMLDTFRMPKDFDSLVYLSMALQAEGIRYGVEHWRRHMDRVAGTLYWQLDDCWPVASWSSLDYFGRWKALHYAARRFYAPVMLSIEDRPPEMGIHVTNDLREPWEGIIRWSLETLAGTVLTSGKAPVYALPMASTQVCNLDFSDRVSDENCREVVFVAELWQGDRRAAMQVATFVPTKHLALADPGVTANLTGAPYELVVDLAARSLARLVELSLDGADVVFSDNYFDLPARRSVTISCPLPAGWNLEQARAALKTRSVYNSF